MRILLDTSAYSALMAGNTEVRDALSRYEAVLMSPIVIGELYDGFEEDREIKTTGRHLPGFSESHVHSAYRLPNTLRSGLRRSNRDYEKKDGQYR